MNYWLFVTTIIVILSLIYEYISIENAVDEAEAKAPEDLTENDKMALLGRPKLGDITKASLRITESKEFKSTVDKLVQRANHNLLLGRSSYKQQFADAWNISPGNCKIQQIILSIFLDKVSYKKKRIL